MSQLTRASNPRAGEAHRISYQQGKNRGIAARMLKYPPFAAVPRIKQVALGASPFRQGYSDPGIAVLQGALVDLGIKLPRSTIKHGAPDGIFGQETSQAIRGFQSKNKLKPDGIVGKRTLVVLDQLMMARLANQPPIAPTFFDKTPPPNDDYQIGQSDPVVAPDRGSGPWNSTPTQAVYQGLKIQIINMLPHACVAIGTDAAKHMAHYFGNSGKPLTINLEEMLHQVPSAQENLEIEAAQAQKYAEGLPEGRHWITARSAEQGYNDKDECRNWYYAIGGYQLWGKGQVSIRGDASVREYELDFEYKVFDRYNWDKGKQVTIFGYTVTDEFMGEFHRQGLAREFDCVGAVRRKLTWAHGRALQAVQLRHDGGRK